MQFASRLDNVETSAIRELFKLLGKPGIISFAGGFPDSAMFDVEGLKAAAEHHVRHPLQEATPILVLVLDLIQLLLGDLLLQVSAAFLVAIVRERPTVGVTGHAGGCARFRDCLVFASHAGEFRSCLGPLFEDIAERLTQRTLSPCCPDSAEDLHAASSDRLAQARP